MTETTALRQAIDAKLQPRLVDGKFIDWRGLLDVIAEVFSDGSVGVEDTDAIVEYAEELYEQYVRPFDIPGIPNIFEDRVDDIIKGMIRPAVTALLERLDAEDNEDGDEDEDDEVSI